MNEFNVKETLQKYSVVFSMSKIDFRSMNMDSILIYPSEDKFNNFGFRTFCHYFARTSIGIELSGILHLAFLADEPRPQNVISSVTERNGVGSIESSKLPHFFSMLPTMQDYRDVVSKLGPKNAKEFLFSLNDLVAYNHFGKIPTYIEGATNTKVFKLSFFRNSETFFAYYNAGSILNGLTSEVLGEVSTSLNLEFKLDGFANSHQLAFNFDLKSFLPKRICVVIGKNGVGKSQSLGNIARLALSGDKLLSDALGERPSINRLIAIGTPGEARVTFPAERRTSRINYRRLSLSRTNGKDGWRGLGELLIQLARSEESIRGSNRWKIFCDTISSVIPLDEIAVPLLEGSDLSRWCKQYVNGTTTLIKFSELKCGGEQASLETWGAIQPKSDPVRFLNGKGYGLSSGQLAFFRFAAQACLYIENGTLILLDEPETHLHPNLITSFVELLDHLLETTGSIAIIATHSAYFVREVPRSQTLVLQETSEGSIDVLTPRLRTFGADVGSISHFVFADNMTNKLLNKVKEKIFESNCDVEKFLKEAEDELSMEAVMSLRRKLGEEAPV